MTHLLTTSALVLALLPMAFPSHAAAASDSAYAGGCRALFATDLAAGPGRQIGEIDVAVVVYSAGSPSGNPVSAEVTCYFTVNGVRQPGTTVTAEGTTAITGGSVVSFASESPDDDIKLCTIVEYTSDATPTVDDCDQQYLRANIGAAACAAPAASGPPGLDGKPIVHVGPDGDVWIGDKRYHDCPPYANPS